VDDLKILVRAARSWGDIESRRASARAAEISGFLPAERPTAPSPAAGQSGPAFLAAETANIAAGLELVLTGPADASAPSNVIQRLRALRGIAAIRDVPPLAEVLEAADDAVRPLEAQGQLPPENRELLEAAAAVIRDAAKSLRGHASAGSALGPVSVTPEAIERFEAALGRLADAAGARERVVPVSNLFFDDGGPHVVAETSHPPTTRADRLRLEMVGHGEHLRRLIGDARGTADPAGADRGRRSLRRALISVRHTAESFGEDTIATTISALAESLTALDATTLSVLSGVAELLSSPGQDSERLRTELPRMLAGRVEPAHVAAADARSMPTPTGGTDSTGLTWIHEVVPTPVASQMPVPPGARPPVPPGPAAAASPPPAPLGAGLATLLDMGIASVEELNARPLAAPVAVEETLVPIELLIYRGEAAWRRALELRDDLRKQNNPPAEALEELYDLLDLVGE
jgi:hypothetical protein